MQILATALSVSACPFNVSILHVAHCSVRDVPLDSIFGIWRERRKCITVIGWNSVQKEDMNKEIYSFVITLTSILKL
jgi:hypothetical protein